MKVLVTGANGFAGGWLLRRLTADGCEVTATAGRGGTPAPSADVTLPGVRWLQLELSDADSVRAAVTGSHDAVIHLAAMASTTDAARDPGEAWIVNAAGTARLVAELARAKQAGVGDPVVLVVSSGEVYGPGQCTPRSELDPARPISPYAASKLGAEIAALEAWRRGGLQVVIVRPFSHTGPNQPASYVVPAFARRLVGARTLGNPAVRVGNLDPVRDFLHVRDVVDAYVRLLVQGVPGEIYNVASGQAIRLEDLLFRMGRLLGVDPIPESDPELRRPADVPHLVGDATKLRAVTGWEPRTSLEDTLREVLDAQAG